MLKGAGKKTSMVSLFILAAPGFRIGAALLMLLFKQNPSHQFRSLIYTILLSKNTFERIGDYADHLRDGGQSGEYLRKSLKGITIEALDTPALLSALLNSKKPQIFAET